jgi:alpha-glucosidase
MDLLKQLSLTLRFIKLKRFLGSLSYLIQRDRLKRQVARSRSLEVFEEIGSYLKAKPTPNGGYLSFEPLNWKSLF